ncbi:MAG: 50S ribosomal protein L7/L12 [uncultured bacterium]|nr:MAG: 50S ribosomal protein L7/L12 [uncultured bacterium]
MTTDIEHSLQQMRQALDNAATQLHFAQQIMQSLTGSDMAGVSTATIATASAIAPTYQGNQQIVEGVFNGQNMVGADGKIYTIPANYASKSKLVEGDILKLTIRPDGSFIYKQIGPVERKRSVGTLVCDNHTGEYSALVGDRSYKLILAAVTYYKGQSGDEIIVLTPADGESMFAAVENLIHQVETPGLLPDGSAAELPNGDTAELSNGETAELPAGAAAELADGSAAEIHSA